MSKLKHVLSVKNRAHLTSRMPFSSINLSRCWNFIKPSLTSQDISASSARRHSHHFLCHAIKGRLDRLHKALLLQITTIKQTLETVYQQNETSLYLMNKENRQSKAAYTLRSQRNHHSNYDYHNSSGSNKCQDFTNMALCSAVLASSVPHHDDSLSNDEDMKNITSTEMDCTIKELQEVLEFHSADKDGVSGNGGGADDDWSLEWSGPAVTIWSRPIENRSYRQYKVHGRYKDIPAIAFFYIQVTTTQRESWDSNTDEIVQLVSNKADLAEYFEQVYWRVNFPRPLAKRDYVFARRHVIDLEKNALVLINRAVLHPDHPEKKNFVRVTDYESKMLVQPHTTFTENGFDYIMTYIDDTKTRMPDYALKKVVRNGLPRFLSIVCQESSLVMSNYRALKASNSDLSTCGDARVKELHGFIEEALLRQKLAIEKQSPSGLLGDEEQSPGDCHDKDLFPTPKLTAIEDSTFTNPARPILIHKIQPPSQLPDVSKYLHSIFTERKFTPIPLKRVHRNYSESDRD